MAWRRSPDLRSVTDLAPTAPPWRLANRLDETRRIRLAARVETQFRVVFDCSIFDTLGGVITSDTVIATGHPNHDLAEFGFRLTGTQLETWARRPGPLRLHLRRSHRPFSRFGCGSLRMSDVSAPPESVAGESRGLQDK